jgi:type I restriction enzyme M protein
MNFNTIQIIFYVLTAKAVAVIRYLNGAKRALIALVEKLWDKYAVSSRELEAERAQTLGELNEFLVKLGYVS